jgi:hypothetical protein
MFVNASIFQRGILVAAEFQDHLEINEQ